MNADAVLQLVYIQELERTSLFIILTQFELCSCKDLSFPDKLVIHVSRPLSEIEPCLLHFSACYFNSTMYVCVCIQEK